MGVGGYRVVVVEVVGVWVGVVAGVVDGLAAYPAWGVGCLGFGFVLVAEGAGEVAVDPIASPWDIAPLLLICEEAGGRATSLDGVRSIYRGSLVSTNGRMHDAVLDVLGGSGEEHG